MNTNKIFTGNLVCDKEEKGTFVFLQVGEQYVFLDEVNNIFDLIKLRIGKSEIKKFGTEKVSKYHIDRNTLMPYYEKQKQKTLGAIKMDYLVDPRNPRGLNI